MSFRIAAGLAGLALAFHAVPAAASPGGTADTAPGTRPRVAPDRDLPPARPPIAPEAEGNAPPPASPQAVLVQGYVKTATKERLVLSAPGTTETLSLSIDPETQVLSSGDEHVSVENLKQGQLVRAALVPSGQDLVAVVVEVMPGEADRTPPGAAAAPRSRQGGTPPAAPKPPGPSSPSPSGPSPAAPGSGSVR